MDETLRIDRARVRVHGFAVKAELHDVGRFDQPWRACPRQQEALRVARIARADVAVAVDDVLVVEDAVADDEVVDQRLEFGTRAATAGGGLCLFCHGDHPNLAHLCPLVPAEAGTRASITNSHSVAPILDYSRRRRIW
jgi:hypothetical protein